MLAIISGLESYHPSIATAWIMTLYGIELSEYAITSPCFKNFGFRLERTSCRDSCILDPYLPNKSAPTPPERFSEWLAEQIRTSAGSSTILPCLTIHFISLPQNPIRC